MFFLFWELLTVFTYNIIIDRFVVIKFYYRGITFRSLFFRRLNSFKPEQNSKQMHFGFH